MIKPLITLSGQVVHGRGKGRGAGMPTANLSVDPGMNLPPPGVYATVTRAPGARLLGVTNVGPRPSVDDDPAVTVETYLPGYAGDLYGQRLELDFYLWMRPVMKMDGLDQVKRQVDRDARQALTYLGRLLDS